MCAFISTLLRPAEASDFEFFFQIKSEAKNMYWTGHTEKPNREMLHEWFGRNLESDIRTILIYLVDAVPVGYAYIDCFEDHFETAVGVSENFEGKGYGQAIVNQTIQFCRKISQEKAVFAWVFDSNHASIKIHLRAGFMETDSRKYYKLGNGKMGRMTLYICEQGEKFDLSVRKDNYPS